jgi:CHAT domain-containing protein
MAPRYSQLAAKLSKAEATAKQLLDNAGAKGYAARPVAGTREAMLELLEKPPEAPVAMLYFTGHGLFNDTLASASAIKLEKGESLAADEVNRDEVALGTRDGTVVFFNACEVGATAGAIGEVGGWAGALLARRFRAFIAPLWAVDEEDASQATLDLIEQVVVQRQPIGAALRDLRRKHGAVSPTFYSYILYGDVTARFGA